VVEDDLSWLVSLRNDRLLRARRVAWLERSPLGAEAMGRVGVGSRNGGTLVVVHGTDRVGTISWRRVQTGPTASNLGPRYRLAPEFRGRGYGSQGSDCWSATCLPIRRSNRIEATTEITNDG